MKDLNDNMMDVHIYQENLGDELRAGTLNDAEWLLNGMDSILILLGQKFSEHRKLERGFSYYYNKELRKPIDMIRVSIKKNDTAKALKGYRIMVKNCNGCHIDHDVDKTVRE